MRIKFATTQGTLQFSPKRPPTDARRGPPNPACAPRRPCTSPEHGHGPDGSSRTATRGATDASAGSARFTAALGLRAVAGDGVRHFQRELAPAHGHLAVLQLEVGVHSRKVGDRRRSPVHQLTVALQQGIPPDSPDGVNATGEGYRQGTPQRVHHKNRCRFQCPADPSRHSP